MARYRLTYMYGDGEVFSRDFDAKDNKSARSRMFGDEWTDFRLVHLDGSTYGEIVEQKGLGQLFPLG